MNIRLVFYVLGAIALLLAAAMLPSLGIALWGETSRFLSNRAAVAFTVSMGVCLLVGGMLRLLGRSARNDRITFSEGFAITTLGWITMAILGSLPYFFCHHLGIGPSPRFTWIDGYFESMSGFSTTGASVFGTPIEAGGLGLIESLPRSLLFWRSMTHWIGGMGIVLLTLAILPALRAGGYLMYRAEIPGPTADRLRPRIQETAAILWGVYIFFTGIETFLLWISGMPVFDAICHAFGTMATGGFSTKDASIGFYGQSGDPRAWWYEIVILFFMFLAGCNFLLHYQALQGRIEEYGKSGEFRFYVAVTFLSIVFLTGMTYGQVFDSFFEALRYASFQVISILTTTGFTTYDFDLWPGSARFLLLLLMFFGGCAGSTGGGLKQIRILVILRFIHREILRLLRPPLMNRVRIADTTLEEETVGRILSLAVTWVVVYSLATLLLFLVLEGTKGEGRDRVFLTAPTAVAACLNNIGPGLGAVGPSCNYGWLSPSAKLLLTFCMLLGRLEIYSVLVIFLPLAWRR